MGAVDADYGNYCDEGAVIVARHLPHLRTLWAEDCELGWEAAAAISNNLPELEELWLIHDTEIMQGWSTIGRLPKLKELGIRNC